MLKKYKGPQKVTVAAADEPLTPSRSKKIDKSKNDAATKPNKKSDVSGQERISDDVQMIQGNEFALGINGQNRKKVQFEEAGKSINGPNANQNQGIRKSSENEPAFQDKPSLVNNVLGKLDEANMVVPISEIADECGEQTDQKNKRKVLDQLARLYADQEADRPCIISYHYKYKEYLYDYNLIDPERAKIEEEMEKKRLAKQVDQQILNKKAQEQQQQQVQAIKDTNEIDLNDQDDESAVATGKLRYDMLIKSMIARIEFNNCLAPVQEYGRHQQKVANRKKKKAKPAATQQVVPDFNRDPQSPSDLGAKYDDNYYDLDDDFIDDNDLDINHDEMVTEMLYDGNSQLYSNASHTDHIDNLDFVDKGEREGAPDNDENDDDSELDEVANLRQQAKYERLLRNFRVLLPEEVEDMINEGNRTQKNKEEEVKKTASSGGEKQMTLTTQPNKDHAKLTLGGAAQKGQLTQNGSAEKVKSTKKRTIDEISNTQKTDDQAIDEILNILRQGVLGGDTMNSFKKETIALSELVEKKDPNWGCVSNIVSMKLSQIFQKPEREMLYMMQRTCLLERKKRKKQELDKLISMANAKIKVDLNKQNKKSDDDYLDLEQVDASSVKYAITEDLKELLPNIYKVMNEFVQANNEYINIKTIEEKTKAKRMKQQNEPKFDLLDSAQELEKNLQSLLQGIPEHLQPLVREKLAQAIISKPTEPQKTAAAPSLKPDNQSIVGKTQLDSSNTAPTVQSQPPVAVKKSDHPRKGNQWNQVRAFYELFIKK